MIQSSKRVALFTHISPDADGLGSMCALYCAMKKIGIDSQMYCESVILPKYSYLADVSKISTDDVAGQFDLFVSLDASSLERIGKYASDFVKFPNTAVIDHHPSNKLFAKQNYVDSKKSSCAEIVFDLIHLLGIEMDKDIALALFGGVFSDTGAFCNSNSTSNSLKVAAELSEHCKNYQEVTFALFKRRTQKEFLLWKKSMEQSNFVLKNKVFVSMITNENLDEIGADEQHTNFIISNTGMIDGVLINIFFCEKEQNVFKVSFRSQGTVDVGLVAETLGGGGHKNASGCTLLGSQQTIVDKVLIECEKELERWKKTV